MALVNAKPSNFNPAALQQADQPSITPYGVGSGPDTQEYVRQTPMKGPDGRPYIKQEFIMPDGSVRGAASYISTNPDGSTQRYQPGANGQWVEGQYQNRSFAQTVFGDEKLMTFLAVAGAGAAAGSAWGSGGAGGSMLGSGTGATPGVVAGGVNGTAGLGVGGALGGLGTQGGATNGSGHYDTEGLDNLIQQQENKYGGGAQPGFWNKLGNWLTSGSGGGSGGLDGLFDVLGGAGNLAKDAGSLALMYKMYEDNKDNAKEWRSWMEQGTPDLGFYQGKLKQAYEDPGAWLQGPEYQAAQNVVHNKLQRSDAAGGRLANDFGRQQQLQDHAMGALQEYRGGLGGLVNEQQNTRAGIGGALENAQAAEGDWMKNMMNWLNSQGS